MSNRIYENDAERQRAYRARQRAGAAPIAPAKASRRSRPARILALARSARDLAEEYRDWLGAIPENLAGGSLAERIEATVEQLEELADGLEAIEPPRIGR